MDLEPVFRAENRSYPPVYQGRMLGEGLGLVGFEHCIRDSRNGVLTNKINFRPCNAVHSHKSRQASHAKDAINHGNITMSMRLEAATCVDKETKAVLCN